METFNELNNNTEIEILYFQVTDLWKRFCEEHTLLFDYTCDEYASLLENNLDELERIIDKKNEVIERITRLELVRKEVIEKVNENLKETLHQVELPLYEVTNIRDLLNLMNFIGTKKNQNHLFRFNKLLIDIIEKIQDQNKRNKLFINKAMKNLAEMKREVFGENNFKTYNAQGATKFNT